MKLDAAQRRELLALARASIGAALREGDLARCPHEVFAPELMKVRSSFVTLRIDDALRGCCGTIEAIRPLAADVWRNAWVSAFRDPRFPPLAAQEWPRTALQVSVLSTPEPLPVSDERELLERLQPFADGLILELGDARATFLPAVWEQIPDPASFVRQLKQKAGWPAEFWSPRIRVSRYRAECFEEEAVSG